MITKRMLIRPYVQVWIKHNGMPPWPCEFCNKSINGLGGGQHQDIGIIHHKDRNPENNAIDNLAACHKGCHVRHHNEERAPYSAEMAAKVAAAHLGKPLSEETKAKMSATTRGKPKSEETRKRMSAYARNRKPEHQQKIIENNYMKRKRNQNDRNTRRNATANSVDRANS
jgi:NUMOD3 motif-containing protein